MRKRILFFLGLLFLIVILIYCYFVNINNCSFWYSNDDFNSYVEYRINYMSKNNYMVNYIKLDGNLCSYDRDNDYYLCSVDKISNNTYNIDVNSLYDVKFISSFFDDNYSAIDVFVHDDKYYSLFKIYLTTLPLLDIKTNYNINEIFNNNNNIFNNVLKMNNEIIEDDIFVNDKLVFMNLISPGYYDTTGVSFFSSYATLRYRGHDSLNYDKKSYKLNIKKYRNGVFFNNNYNLLGMRNDNDWILDAMYVDYSKIRNTLSSDLWKKISNSDILNYRYVELFIDNEYYGLYCMKEPIDKKALKITDNGSLYKAVLYLNYNESNVSVIDGKYFIRKYPENITSSSIMMYNKISDYYQYLNDESISNDDLIRDYFDLDNFLNYQVFISIIKGVDNFEYNNYYYSIIDSNVDTKIIKTPWDMDLTFGLTFNRVYDYEKYDEIGVNVYYNGAPIINQLIKERYWELRKDVITMDVINDYLDNYKEILVNSGAAKRDSEKWYFYDIESEIEKIRTWINNRINFLDQYFKM